MTHALRDSQMLKGANVVRITDKSFRYTASYNTDIRKTFRKMEQLARAASAGSKSAEPAAANSVVPIGGRRVAPNR